MRRHFISSARSSRFALFATSLGFVIICLDVTVVNVALERIRDGLAIDSTALEWVVNAYTLAFASLLLSAGALSDRFGARRIFVAGFTVFTFASVACGLSGGATMLIASRVLQGVGAALCVPSSLALLGAAFPEPHARAKAVSIWAGTAALALGAGPLVGGVLVDRFGWSAIFLINMPIGIAGIWLTVAHAPDTVRHAARRLDLAGQTLAVITLATLTYAVVESGRRGWTSAIVTTGFAVAVVTGALFIAVEARHAQPLLPLKLFRNAVVNVSAVTGLSLNFGYYGLMFAMSLFFQSARHDTPLETGLAFLPMTAVVTVANVVSGKLTARFGFRLPMAFGQSLAALGYLSLVFVHADSSALAIALPLLTVGVGVALAVPSINTAVLAHVGPSCVGIASGVLNTARQIGGVVGVGVFGSLVRPELNNLAEGLHVAAILAAVVTLSSLITIFLGLKTSGSLVADGAG
ncbi:DHA2 family efflux MFS transporter permease subunit [Paraburkholderia lycopersici]|uniref:MFS transporter, DHA2 family, methylenomycin A resistance protein n=1 Tax=Paraburkholderia lycopersici TaxID=416944 RepID=A0A1G6PCM1_9BURK|nr:DHA2 family efflux MFS transporter permease subunit [Paraburkholderia lycopersici]SDC77903.1 MFS transporter, DHA2 family, methylenomycin A resistance protein [Paraburkholderia lycopersici]